MGMGNEITESSSLRRRYRVGMNSSIKLAGWEEEKQFRQIGTELSLTPAVQLLVSCQAASQVKCQLVKSCR